MATLTIALSEPMAVDHVKVQGYYSYFAMTVVAYRNGVPVWATTFPGISNTDTWTFTTGKFATNDLCNGYTFIFEIL